MVCRRVTAGHCHQACARRFSIGLRLWTKRRAISGRIDDMIRQCSPYRAYYGLQQAPGATEDVP